MEVLSPSQKSKINLRKHLHVSQVQSQSQPNSPKEAHSFHERKFIQSNRISLLSGTTRTANPTVSMDRNTPFNKENALNKVSDFYDKSQIKDAIYSIDTLRDRIKFVDSILKRRVEIKEMEDQARFERASPTIAKAGQKLKSRVLARTQNKSRRSFVLENLKGLSPSHSLASSLVRSEAVSRASPNHINLESSIISPVHGTHREFSFTNSVLSRVGEARISARIESPNSVRKEPVNEELEIKRSNLSPSVSTNQIKRTSNILSLLAHNIQEAEEPTSCLVFDNDENKASTKDSSIDFRVKGARRSIIKGETHRSKAGSLTRDIYNLGGKDLEEDLYKYMVKHDKTQDASQIVANNNDIKEPLMRDIEAKAKTKFITFLDKQKQTNYMLPNSFAVRSHKEGKAKISAGPRKYVSFDKNLELQSSKDKNIIKRNGSSSLVRRVKQEVFREPRTTPNSPKEPALDVNNESFASVTEAKLDKLYRKSYGINKTLSLINSQIYDLTDREQFHKWDEYKQKKEKILKENTKETMRQIHKKNFRKEF